MSFRVAYVAYVAYVENGRTTGPVVTVNGDPRIGPARVGAHGPHQTGMCVSWGQWGP